MAASVDSYTILALAAILLVLVGGALLGRRMMRIINTPVFLAQITKLLQAHSRDRAVKLCGVIPHTFAGRLTLFLLAQRIPAKAPLDDPGASYRSAAATRDFAEVLTQRAGNLQAELRRAILRRSLLALAAFTGAALVALWLWLWGEPLAALSQKLDAVPKVGIWVGVVGGTLSVRALRRDLGDLQLLVDRLTPQLVPEEEMTAGDLEGARRAAAMLRLPREERANPPRA